MNKQLMLVSVGFIFLSILFFFGRTIPAKSTTNALIPTVTKEFNIRQFIEIQKQHLTPSQVLMVSKLENSIIRGDVSAQQIQVYNQLAAFWKDSIHISEPYLFYLSEAAKLDNSEKNLTFAAQLVLNSLRGEVDEAKINWEAEEAIALFEKAIIQNPANDDLKVGLGSCYVFGKGRFGGSAETMKGIQQLLEVVRRDSTNMKAQMVLGIGDSISGQYDKAIERLKKVVTAQPGNLEAVAFLADSYAAKGEKEEAIKWYQVSKKLANNSHYSQEVDERIKSLQ